MPATSSTQTIRKKPAETIVASCSFSQSGTRRSVLSNRRRSLCAASPDAAIGQIAHQARPARKKEAMSVGHQTAQTRTVPTFPFGPASTATQAKRMKAKTSSVTARTPPGKSRSAASTNGFGRLRRSNPPGLSTGGGPRKIASGGIVAPSAMITARSIASSSSRTFANA